MMNFNNRRRGSALLIVLGMLAFMVISAVAFSAYMRTSRLPSSYLRRTVASRMLVKAALANAIEEIDAAIGDNPYPGIGTKRYYFPRGEDQEERKEINRNKWVGRVYIGSDDNGKDSLDASQCLIEQNETVSTLSLEGLAYIPPPLVNEARYYSRHSNAATWHSMGFDAGRYAFTAIDVSDYFDINAVTADGPRNSSPSGRISLSYLFENTDHSSAATTAGGWDTFVGQYIDDKLPLISLADWNLAMGSQQFGGFIKSYFCQYVGGTGQDFYNGAAEGAGIDNIARMAFVTDGWFPSTNVVGAAGDLTDNQPFNNIEAGKNDSSQPSVRDIVSGSSQTRKIIEENLSMLDVISLFDYMDENDVPTSLALPTTERVPMLTALQPNFKIKFTCKRNKTEGGWQSTSDPNKEEREIDYSYTLKVDPQQSMVAGLWMFPFLRDSRSSSFTAEIAIRIGFASKSAALLRVNRSSSGFAFDDESDFTEKGSIKGGVIRLTKSDPLNPDENIVREEDAFIDKALNITDFGSVAGSETEVFHAKWKQTREKDQDGNWIEQPEAKWTFVSATRSTGDGAMYPYDTLSVMHGDYTDKSIEDKKSIPVVPYMTIAARVKKGNKTVDLVPASMSDDRNLNNVQNDGNIANINGGDGDYPILLMVDKNGKELDFSPNGFTEEGTELEAEFQPTVNMKTIFCPDPRWNFAPENFLAVNDAPANVKDYYKNNKAKAGLGVGGRDRDIFMNVSNQGWLQSVAELALLPRCGDQGNVYGDVDSGIWDTATTYNEANGDLTDNDMKGKLRHGNVMWRTYRLYKMDGYSHDDLWELGLYNSSQGFAVSPYSDATNVFMAAFANTPQSWCLAYEDNENIKSMSAKDFNSKYAFNGYNSNAKFDWSDLSRVAGRVMDAMRSSASNHNGDWQSGYDDLDWGDVDQNDNYKDYFCGERLDGDTDDLYEVDRKMLCGFWRDCFAVKQQLFLVFVRAEPLMMGGGGVHQTPPQLGGRAVALVWRDPLNRSGSSDTSNGAPPHRTRILFYRQFD